MHRSLAGVLLLLASAAAVTLSPACGPKCANEGGSCDAGACVIASVACEGGTPVCGATANAANGTACASGGSCQSGFCEPHKTCPTTPPGCAPTNLCRTGEPLCTQHFLIGCSDRGVALASGAACGDGGATCTGGFCSCTQEGSDAGCPTGLSPGAPSPGLFCDRLEDGSLGCRQACAPGAGSGCPAGVSLCAPAFDGGTYVSARCDYRLEGSAANAPCAASSACRRDQACMPETDGGGTCRPYCTRGGAACASGSCVAFGGDALLGTCQP